PEQSTLPAKPSQVTSGGDGSSEISDDDVIDINAEGNDTDTEALSDLGDDLASLQKDKHLVHANSQARKRKRRVAEDNLEDIYLTKLAREDKIIEKRRKTAELITHEDRV